jgi:hypothetical protein
MKEVHVLRKKLKRQNSQSFTISRSIYTVGSSYFSKKNCLKALCMKRFFEYLFLNIKILLIPLLGSSHIYEIMHAGRTSMQPYIHPWHQFRFGWCFPFPGCPSGISTLATGLRPEWRLAPLHGWASIEWFWMQFDDVSTHQSVRKSRTVSFVWALTK